MSAELETPSEGFLERGLTTAFKRLGPLSAGAVASGVVLVSGGAVLRRLLGSRRGVLSWAAMGVLLPLGLWLLASGRDEKAEPTPQTELPELEARQTTIIPEA